jgi:outer membrane protein
MKTSAKILLTAAVAAGALASLPARADDGPFEIRVRAVYLDFAQKSDAIPSLNVPSDAITINKKWIPDIDLEYFFTPNWSSELVLTYPQSQTVTVAGVGDIGTFKHLPPTLTVKYNFLPTSDFRPYVGVGVNLTIISSVNLAVPGVGPLDLDSSSFGVAGQVGFDYKVADHWFVNADVKWVQLSSDVKFDGTKISTVHLDPWLLGVGVGYRF